MPYGIYNNNQKAIAKVKKYQNKFNKKTYRHYNVSFNNVSDNLIIRKLESEESITAYLRDLIMADIDKHGIGEPIKKEVGRPRKKKVAALDIDPSDVEKSKRGRPKKK